jgi:hypothetical protein
MAVIYHTFLKLFFIPQSSLNEFDLLVIILAGVVLYIFMDAGKHRIFLFLILQTGF